MQDQKNPDEWNEVPEGAEDDFGDMADSDLDDPGFEEELDDLAGAEGDEAVAGEDDFIDAEWEDFPEEDGEAPPAAAKKARNKKSGGGMSFNAKVIIVAVIVGFGVLVYQVMTKKPQETVERFASALNMTGTESPVFGKGQTQDSAPGAAASGEQGFLDDPASLDRQRAQIVEDAPPMPTPITPMEDESLTPMPTPAQELAGAQVPRPAPQEDEPAPSQQAAEDVLKSAIEARNKTLAAQEQPREQEPERAAEPAPTLAQEPAQAQSASSFDSAQVAEVEQKVDSLLARLNAIESRLDSLQETGASRDSTLGSELDALKKEVTALASAPKAAPAAATPAPAAEKPAPAKQADAPKPQPKASAPAKTAAPKAAAEPAYDGTAWQLRAAQPGKAWVSKTGSSDMYTVEVGGTLVGIGRITDISYTNGQWVVQGTDGRIVQ